MQKHLIIGEMKAIEVTVSMFERLEIPRFIEEVSDEYVFIYQATNDAMVIVTEGICSMGYVKARIADVFVTAYIKELR